MDVTCTTDKSERPYTLTIKKQRNTLPQRISEAEAKVKTLEDFLNLVQPVKPIHCNTERM